MTGQVTRTRLVAALLAIVLPQIAAATVVQDSPDEGDVAGPSLPKVDEARAKAMGVAFDYDTPPKPKKTRRPEYPKSALKKGIEGTVLIEIVIDRKGHVVQPRVLESIPELDAAALKCIRAWRFKPAIKKGEPVATIAHVPIAFKIQSEGATVEDQPRE